MTYIVNCTPDDLDLLSQAAQSNAGQAMLILPAAEEGVRVCLKLTGNHKGPGRPRGARQTQSAGPGAVEKP